ncbi:MAG: alpha-glucan family phosphorylase [Nitrospirae bacterium]|nr:alpha-glucan family phosphorylase [Nitrospirota bacterium]
MKPVRTFTVVPSLPPRLERLRDLAYNLYWSWDHTTRGMFRRLDAELWEDSGHNPVLMLGRINQSTLNAALEDEGFLSHYDRVCKRLDTYLGSPTTWYRTTRRGTGAECIGYFSAEFALTDCLPLYSGGLGILAGDHLKSAGELGLPMVGVGLLYQQGYFTQYLNADGWQQESSTDNDFYNLPLQPVRDEGGRHLTVSVALPGRDVAIQIWRVQVGRVPLYLLDTNTAANRPEDRAITDQLYGGDIEVRLRQEMVLGMGGLRALLALGLRPTVCHMNEGHSAFLALDRIRCLMAEYGLSFPEARDVAAAGHVFTTHTAVSAGSDYFSPELIERYLGQLYRDLGLSRNEFFALGRQNPDDDHEAFCMTVLALRLSAHLNAVSRLHETVSRRIWGGVWPHVPRDESPLSHVSNGIHVRSWISRDLDELFDLYLGENWVERAGESAVWQGVERIPSVELWRAYERRRERLVAFARGRFRGQLQAKGATESELSRADEVLNPDILTIGFARRFVPYKRATLLLRDPDRLAALLNDSNRPVQIIYAGKAHPRDDAGKELIREILHLARQERFRNRIVFLENYDMEVARYMVQGVDVWLNTPRRGLEASGTSGMKAAANGVLNLSILDGWWEEAYRPELGWAIGRGEEDGNEANRDEVESHALYDLLEKEVVPMFYERGSDHLPRRWIARMKRAMTTLCPAFNTHRMVREYAERFYFPAGEHFERLFATGFARAKSLAAWKAKTRSHWSELRIEKIEAPGPLQLKVGDKTDVKAWVRLGTLAPGDVSVQLYLGRLDARGEIADAEVTQMEFKERSSDGLSLFEAWAVPCSKSGLHGYTVRIVPGHEDLWNPWEMGLVLWA